MKAMILNKIGTPLVLEDIPKPKEGPNQLLIKIHTCGVCRTDLHILKGELDQPRLPLILGHQIVGTVEAVGNDASGFVVRDRVGIPWLGHTCGTCNYCIAGKENLCDNAEYTGYNLNGGFAEYCVCDANYAFHLPKEISDVEVAPLLCAGLIGYRAYRKAHPEKNLGIYGFGSAAHILTQIAVGEGKRVFAFTRSGDVAGQQFAKKLGATWAGSSEDIPPEELDAAIIFASAGELVPQSLKVLKKGGRCICGGIHMSDIPSFPYKDLWMEKSIQSVANLTRNDALEFFLLIQRIPIKVETTVYALADANTALKDLEEGNFKGSAVIQN